MKEEYDIELSFIDVSNVHFQTIPPPRTLTDYDNREFAEEEIIFSSFTYLIDVGRITSALLGINCDVRDHGDDRLTSADAMFVNWFLYLPKCKQELLKEDKGLDETMFKAHLAVNTYVCPRYLASVEAIRHS
jgi:hypothetical protein